MSAAAMAAALTVRHREVATRVAQAQRVLFCFCAALLLLQVCRLLSLGYQLVDRDLYSRVVEEFMRHRGAKGQRPSADWV